MPLCGHVTSTKDITIYAAHSNFVNIDTSKYRDYEEGLYWEYYPIIPLTSVLVVVKDRKISEQYDT